ncbi:MAG: NAD-dependent DNA ligase LigA, partial [Ignavibacteria bacterium]|nr:NAD-dependent DNA ligase LigA [Ignavibacteria bacterium]
MKTSPEKRIKELRLKISEADYKYYVLDSPDMEDYEYDGMMKELTELEEKHPHLIAKDSPTQRVSGEPTKKFGIVTHSIPMLSLTNTYSLDELIDFDKRIAMLLPGQEYEYVCELKFDGLAVSLVYENGYLSRGATRGDGINGD